MSRRSWVALALVLLGSVVWSRVEAGTISLAWDPVEHPDLAGYRIYYDTAPGVFGNSVDVGLVTAATLSGVADCTTYTVAVKAYDGEGGESPEFSNAISGWARPSVSSVTPAEVEQNGEVELTIDGANFQPGAAVVFSNPAISVLAVDWSDCHRLVVSAVVAGDAALGPGSLEVVNPDQVFGVGSDLVAVVADGTAPAIAGVEADPVAATEATVIWSTDEPADGQVYFRRLGESSYQTTAVDPALVTEHSLTLQGLMPETTYEFHVRSVDGGDNASSSADQTFLTATSSFTYLRFEAEVGVLEAPVGVATGAGAFGGGWLALPEAVADGTADEAAGTASFGFYTPHAATWQVWVRVHGSAGAGWLEQVDDAGFAALGSEQAGWTWVAARAYELEGGLHRFELGGLLAGSMADRILVTDDPEFVATELPGDDVSPPPPVVELEAAPADEANALSWTYPADGDAQIVVVRFRTDGAAPVSPVDGLPLVATTVTPGGTAGYDHTGLVNGTPYVYAVFLVDGSGNASAAATVEATPQGDPPGAVENVVRTDTH
jgi:hypothetical protein